MKPIDFAERNVVFAENQPEYLPLPAHKSEDGEVTTFWKLSLKERIKILIQGILCLRVLTVNQPLQPIKMSIKMSIGRRPRK